MTSMEPAGKRTESAALLKDLARPLVAGHPEPKLQKTLISALEEGIRQSPQFDKHVFFAGAFEITEIPDSVEELAARAKLTNLPSKYEAEEAPPGTLTHSIPNTNLNGFPVVESTGIAQDLVRYTLLTMATAGQLEYLRKSGFLDEGWMLLVEIHYYRHREYVGNDMLHKDTYGETIFVNLNYDTDVAIPGPEYVLNPPVVEEHEAQIHTTLPAAFLNDLRWIRSELGKPTQIDIATIQPGQFVAFVDEAIHHMSPHYGGRTVKPKQLTDFLTKEYGPDQVKDAQRAWAEFRKQTSSITGKLFSYVSAPNPFSHYLKVISPDDAGKWLALIEMTETKDKDKEYDRISLLDAGMSTGQIDRLLAETWEGYQQVNIPKAEKVPATETPLKRQASTDALNKNLPPKPTGDRRFFRTWVRVVRADRH